MLSVSGASCVIGAAFTLLVLHIVKVRPKPEVVGIDADGHVAFMEDVEIGRKRAPKFLVGGAMSSHKPACNAEVSVAVGVDRSKP
jgi:hypothetical protein